MSEHALADLLKLGTQFQGRVRQALIRDPANPISEVLFDGKNLVVDSALELMILALQGEDSIRNVDFGYTGGRPITPGLRSIGSPVASAQTGAFADTRPFASRDSRGLRSIGTWTAVLTPSSAITYDTLGLVSSVGLLFAAVAFAPVALAAGETISVQWTIFLRGT